jgi:hypothetical protein
VLRAILEIIAAVFRIIPGWKQKRTQNIEGEWRDNRTAIERDLRGESWWLRNNDTSDTHNGDS